MFWGAITNLLIALKPDFFQIDPLAGETAIYAVADFLRVASSNHLVVGSANKVRELDRRGMIDTLNASIICTLLVVLFQCSYSYVTHARQRSGDGFELVASWADREESPLAKPECVAKMSPNPSDSSAGSLIAGGAATN